MPRVETRAGGCPLHCIGRQQVEGAFRLRFILVAFLHNHLAVAAVTCYLLLPLTTTTTRGITAPILVSLMPSVTKLKLLPSA